MAVIQRFLPSLHKLYSRHTPITQFYQMSSCKQLSTTSIGSSSENTPTNADGEQKSGGGVKKAQTPVGRLDDAWSGAREQMTPQASKESLSKVEKEAYTPFPEDKNPETGEIGGPKGPEPTRYGDWERKGRVIDF